VKRNSSWQACYLRQRRCAAFGEHLLKELLNEAHWKALETPFLADWKRSENTLKTPEIGRPPKKVDHWKDKKKIFISNH
jgi:hypothetical protein